MKKFIFITLFIATAISLHYIYAAFDAFRLRHESPAHVPSYQLPTPAPPTFTPDPEVLAFANAVLANRPWLEARSSDDKQPPGASPATTFIVSRVEPVITRDGNDWKITFKP